MEQKINIEIKARCHDSEVIKTILENANADYKGIDHQIDTYFNCPTGRLKLRAGNIENSLIFYKRSNQKGPKRSDVHLEVLQPENNLAAVLDACYGIKVKVDKKRGIYFIENIKFHIDEVEGLGSFVEIEAIDGDGSLGVEKLRAQCDYYMDLFNIQEEDLVSCSYSDLLLEKKLPQTDFRDGPLLL